MTQVERMVEMYITKAPEASLELVCLFELMYRCHNCSLVSDSYYDSTCRRILEMARTNPDIAGNWLFEKCEEGLSAGAPVMSESVEDYPEDVQDMAHVIIGEGVEVWLAMLESDMVFS